MKVEDFRNPLFDSQPAVLRGQSIIDGHIYYKEVIEGVTRTDEFNVIGFTYLRGVVSLVSPVHGLLFEATIEDSEGFNKCLKRADKHIARLERKK